MIKNKIQQLLYMLMLTPLFTFGVVAGVSTTAAAVACPPANVNSGNPLQAGADCAQGNGQNESLTNVFKIVVNVLLFLVGAVAVIMLVIGGLRYVTSNGDQNAVTGAKNTILYAIIGIVVAFLAFAAVNFVTDQLISTAPVQ